MFPDFTFLTRNPLNALRLLNVDSREECIITCQVDTSCKAGQYLARYSGGLCSLLQLPSNGYVTAEQFKNFLYADGRAFSFYKKDADKDKEARQKHNRRLVKGRFRSFM
jgi:hypothetical protein